MTKIKSKAMKTEIEKYDPCQEALEFRRQFDTFKDAWEACPRGDWMLWIAQKAGVDLQTLTLAKGHCANTIRHLMADERSIRAVDTAIAFGEGKATREELDAARYAAYTAANDASYAVDAHTHTYTAAVAASDAADTYTDAYAYARDVAYVAYVDTKKQNQKQTADICRKYLTDAVMEKILKQDQ